MTKIDNGERIKRARNSTGLSQKDIAEKLGITQQSYSNWESGRANPSPENLRKLADILEVSPSYILGWEDENRRDKMTIYIDMLIEKTVNEKIVWVSAERGDDKGYFTVEQFNNLSDLYDQYETALRRNNVTHYDCAFSETVLTLANQYYKDGEDITLYGSTGKLIDDFQEIRTYFSTESKHESRLEELLEAINQTDKRKVQDYIDDFISDLQELEKE